MSSCVQSMILRNGDRPPPIHSRSVLRSELGDTLAFPSRRSSSDLVDQWLARSIRWRMGVGKEDERETAMSASALECLCVAGLSTEFVVTRPM